MSYLGQFFSDLIYKYTDYRPRRVGEYEELFGPAIIFSNYVLKNVDRITCPPDTNPWSVYEHTIYLKFLVKGSDRKNNNPRSNDENAIAIWNEDQDPEKDIPVLKVHYGRILEIRWVGQTKPTPVSFCKAFAYLTQFQELSQLEKEAYLTKVDPKAFQEYLAQKDEETILHLFQNGIVNRNQRKQQEYQRQIVNLREQIFELHNAYLQSCQQTDRLNDMTFDYKAIKRLKDVNQVAVDRDYLVIETHQIPVRHYDVALYERYKSNYYHDYRLEMMNHVMAGRAEICCHPKTIYIRFNDTKLNYNIEINHRRSSFAVDHPHRTCSGNFANSIDKCRLEYDLYGLISNLLQWFSSLSFDDATVAVNWLWRYSGFRIKDQPDTLVFADDQDNIQKLIQKLDRIQAEEEQASPDLNLDLDLNLNEGE